MPQGVSSITIGATARDLGGNQGFAEEVVLVVVPDDKPTVAITSPAQGSSVTEGTTIPVTVNAIDDVAVVLVQFLRDGVVQLTDFSEPYTANISVPLGATSLTLTAVVTDTAANSVTSEPVSLVVLPDQPPTVVLLEPIDGQEVVEGSTIQVVAGALDDVGVASVRFLVDGVQELEDLTDPFEFDFLIPLGITQFSMAAVAVDTRGQETASAEVTIAVIPDPGTTVQGFVVLQDGFTPAVGATVQALEENGLTQSDGSFSLPGVRTAPGPITVTASLDTEEGLLTGRSVPTAPIIEGITDVGAIELQAVGIGMVADGFTDSVTIFDPATDTVLGSVSIGPAFAIGDCSITADGTLGFATDFANRVWVIDMTALTLAPPPNPIPISNSGEDTSITPDGRFLVVCDGGAAQPISVIDIATQTQISTLFLGSDCNSVEVCSDGSVLVTSNNNGNVRRLAIDGAGTLTDTGEVLFSGGAGFASGPNNVFCAPGGTSGIVVRRSPLEIRSFTIPGLTLIDSRSLTGGAFSGISGLVHPAGDRVYVRSNGGAVDAFSHNSVSGALGAAPLFSIPISSTPTFFGMDQMAITPDGTRLYVSQPSALDVYDSSTGVLLTSITDPSIVRPTGVCFPSSR